MTGPDFDRSVFVNCPFDHEYEPILQAILYCLVRFGLKPRIASERKNAGETRIEKIRELIQTSRYSIHDLSRAQASQPDEIYRLNMPFELGMDFGCRHYGGAPYSDKIILILEEKQYLYQAAISDLAGNDIVAHEGNYHIAVREVRNWLATNMPSASNFLGAEKVIGEYEDFQRWNYLQLACDGFSEEDIQNYPTSELLEAMKTWLALGKPSD